VRRTLQASVLEKWTYPPESRRVERTRAMTSSKIELTELLFARARFSLSMAAHIRRTHDRSLKIVT
jgi:hypothetical protein